MLAGGRGGSNQLTRGLCVKTSLNESFVSEQLLNSNVFRFPFAFHAVDVDARNTVQEHKSPIINTQPCQVSVGEADNKPSRLQELYTAGYGQPGPAVTVTGDGQVAVMMESMKQSLTRYIS